MRTAEPGTRPEAAGSSEPTASSPQAVPPPPTTWGRVRSKTAAYVALTKPRIIELLLVTTLPTMILAQSTLPSATSAMPSLWLVAATLVGGALAAGSANTLNCYIDRDIDQLMARTRKRPLVTGAVTPREALVFGVVLGVVSIAWFAVLVNVVAAALTLAAILLYVVGYTLILKRRTSQNIVWGGSAGCMPVLIGWSAVTGGLDWAALVLFGVIFFWTPPHYWPLSMKFKRDYASANVPMLPVVAADTRVAREMVAYGVAMVACTLALIPIASMGWLYSVTAVAAGAWFLWACVGLYRRATGRAAGRGAGKLQAMKVFHASITYLTLVFVAIAVDPFLPF